MRHSTSHHRIMPRCWLAVTKIAISLKWSIGLNEGRLGDLPFFYLFLGGSAIKVKGASSGFSIFNLL